MTFETLRERYVIYGNITAKTPLHVGKGRGEKALGEADLPVLRLPDDRLYIPGSTLKGCLRSEAERILTGFGINVCIYTQLKGISPDYECESEKSCAGCDIFGSTKMASRIIVRDAISEEKVSHSRLGIAIRRDTKTVDPAKGPFEIEFVAPGTTFRMEIVVENPEKWMLGLIFSAFELIPAIGGQVSRGMGKVEIKVTKVEKWTAESIVKQEPAETYKDEERTVFIEECKKTFQRNIDRLKEKYGRLEKA